MTSNEAEVRARIERYLGRVEAHLEGLPEEERDEVLHDVEAHIYDALSQRDEDGDAVAAVEAVLIEMDPPSSWGPAPHRAAIAPPFAIEEPASGSRFPIESILLGIAAAVLILCLLPVWGAKAGNTGVPIYGLVAFCILLAVASVVAVARFAARTTGLAPLDQRARVGGLSFILLVAGLGAIFVTVAAAAALPDYVIGWGGRLSKAEFTRRQIANEAMRDVLTVVIGISNTFGVLTFLLSWLLGRFAISATRDGSRITGWSFWRAAFAPAMVALAAIGFLLAVPPLTWPILDEIWRSTRLHDMPSHPPLVMGFCVAALAAAGILIAAGLMIRYAPSVTRAVFYPVTARLEPGLARWVLLAGRLHLLAFGVLVYATLSVLGVV